MDDSFKQNELSDEDLAVLQAFDTMDMENWERESSSPTTPAAKPGTPPVEQDILPPDAMLALFVEEVNADLTAMARALHKLRPEEGLDISSLQALQRTAHKIKGTAGTVGCLAISGIALHMEELIALVLQGSLAPLAAASVLAQTVSALELTLKSLVTYGHESSTPLLELEAEYTTLKLELEPDAPVDDEGHTPVRIAFRTLVEEGASTPGSAKTLQELPAAAPFVRVDVRRLERLALHSQQLAELSAVLENAQAEVEKGMQELQTAQARLRQLESRLSTTLSTKIAPHKESSRGDNDRPTSSLVARILYESTQRNGGYSRRNKHAAARLLQAGQSLQWDVLEMDHYTENDVLIHAFYEAIDDVATASAQVRLAIDKLNRLTHQHIDQGHSVHNDTLLLRLHPISILLARIERAITMSASAQQRQIQFVVEGETTEIDQDILEELKRPLLQLVRTCLASSFEVAPPAEESAASGGRVWLYVRPIANEVAIELGFSLVVGGGAIEEVQEALRRLHGSITAGRNAEGGISFHLRLPRSQGAVQSLLVRAGYYRLLVPFSQVQRIDYGLRQGSPPALALSMLLGCAGDQDVQGSHQTVLVLQPGSLQSTVEVDQVLGDVELVVKPLAPHLRRPGITGAAIDGIGNVLLMVDVFELLRYYERHQRLLPGKFPLREGGLSAQQAQLTVVIADDSVYMRRSLQQTLHSAGYRVLEARDGMEALELLLTSHDGNSGITPPLLQALVLDLEMPNLNGYDLLSMLRAHPELAELKIVMLTSRSSEKHKARAHELGAHAYLTKPCAPEVLLETLQSLLKH